MTTAEKIALVERYILDRKGIAVTINTPDNMGAETLLNIATYKAKQWYDTRQPR